MLSFLEVPALVSFVDKIILGETLAAVMNLTETLSFFFPVITHWSPSRSRSRNRSRSYFTTDSQSVSQPVGLGIEHPCRTCDQISYDVGFNPSTQSHYRRFIYTG
jgi:hypothetical protein